MPDEQEVAEPTEEPAEKPIDCCLVYCTKCGKTEVWDTVTRKPVWGAGPEHLLNAIGRRDYVFNECEVCKAGSMAAERTGRRLGKHPPTTEYVKPIFDRRLFDLHAAVMSQVGAIEETEYEPVINALGFLAACVLRSAQQ